MTLKERLARTIFFQAHPRSDWYAHPNARQAAIQERLIMDAKFLIRELNRWTGTNLDPDAEVKRGVE